MIFSLERCSSGVIPDKSVAITHRLRQQERLSETRASDSATAENPVRVPGFFDSCGYWRGFLIVSPAGRIYGLCHDLSGITPDEHLSSEKIMPTVTIRRTPG